MATETQDTRPPTPDEILDGLLERFAWWPAGQGHVIDMANPQAPTMSFATMANTWAFASWLQGKTKINPAHAWRDDQKRAHVAGLRFDPTTPDCIVEHDGQDFVNLYRGLPHGDGAADPEAVEVFEDFLTHLLPDRRERDWFRMWLGAKMQKPHIPNSAVLMVHDKGGAGRGTLFDMLESAMGAQHVKNASATEILGGGSQGQYTSWIENKLLVTCDEVLAGGDSDGAVQWKRREAYEKLKSLVDTRSRTISIIRKGIPNGEATVYASFLLATNHMNALPLMPNDRRFTVLLNGLPLIENPDLMARLEPWRSESGGWSAAFGRAVFRHLRGVAVDWAAVREAMKDTEGRARMLAANGGDTEEMLEQVLLDLPGDYVLAEHLRERLLAAMRDTGLEGEFPKVWRRAQDILAGQNDMGWRRIPGRNQNVQPQKPKQKKAVVFYRESVGIQPWLDAPLEERPALWQGATRKGVNLAVVKKLAEHQNRGTPPG